MSSAPSKPSNDIEVFEYLVQGQPDDSVELGFMAYAIYAFEKWEWYRQFVETSGHEPPIADLNQWISQITRIRYIGMREEAARIFDAGARAYLEDEIALGREQARNDAIITEIKAVGAFWKQLAVALITAILAPIIIGGIIAAVLTWDRTSTFLETMPPHAVAPPTAKSGETGDHSTVRKRERGRIKDTARLRAIL